eukprot:jgi/Ulvmu1/10781/UM069_0015.1
MKRGLAALERKAAKQAKNSQRKPAPASGQRDRSETAGRSGSGTLSSKQGHTLPKALALQLQLPTHGSGTPASLDKLLRQLLRTNSAHSSQLENAARDKLLDKTVSLLPSRRNKPNAANPSSKHSGRGRSTFTCKVIQELKHDILEDPAKAEKISHILGDAWQTYAAQVVRQSSGAPGKLITDLSLIGAPVSVTACRDPRLTGVEGTCVWDNSCNVHVLVCNHPGGSARLAVLSKRATAFSVQIPEALAARVGQACVHHIGDLCAHAAI